MAKQKNSISAFDEIITQFGSDEDRDAFLGLAEKNPFIKEFGLRQADYSRHMNDFKDDVEFAEKMKEWRASNWDDAAEMTKAEKAKNQEIARLQTEKEDLERKIAFSGLGGDEMTFEQLEEFGNNLMKNKKIVTQDDLTSRGKEMETYVTNLNKGTATAALTVPYLLLKHKDEFGELFEPEAFLNEAVGKGRYDLVDYYEKDFVTAKRQAKQTTSHQAEIDRVKAEKDAEIAQLKQHAEAVASRVQGMGSTGMNPSDDGGSSMGAFQKQYLKLDKQADTATGAPEVPLGDGGIAAYAAAKYRQELVANRS